MLDQMKIKNLTNILVCLFSKKCATKAELVQNTGLSNSTVSSAVNSLLKLGLLICAGMQDSIGGRRSAIYRLNKDYGTFIGIDLDGESLTLAITGCENDIVDIYTKRTVSGTPLIHQLIALLEHTLLRFPNVLGIGIGLPAEIEFKEQVVIRCKKIGWEQVHLKEIIERRFMIFTYVDHRANGAALNEGLTGRAAEVSNYMSLYESSKEKATLVLNKKICRGEKNCTGIISSDTSFFAWLSSLLCFLDVSDIFIGYCTEKFQINVKKLLQNFNGRVVCFPESDYIIALGMAAAAEKEWFQSIYFRL